MEKCPALWGIEALQESWHANPDGPFRCLPKVQTTCTDPRFEVSGNALFRNVVVVEDDDVNFVATAGAPCRDSFCTVNNHPRLRLNRNPRRPYRRDSLHFVHDSR